MKVNYAQSAREDLDAIRRWIARDDRARAIGFVRELQAAADELENGPELYPLLDGVRFPGVHRRNYRGYRIFYRVTVEEILIIHVHHGRRATPAL